MTRRIFTLLFLFAFALLAFNVRPGATQSERDNKTPAVVRQQAIKLLESSKSKYLSGTGRNALNLIVGEVEGLGRRQPPESMRTAAALPQIKLSASEVLVNDPAKDVLTNDFDISTQSETAVASFNNTVLVAYNDSGEYAFTNSFTGYSRSTDGGKSFTDAGALPIPGDFATFNFGDPALVADRSGNFYAAFIAADFSGARPFEFANTIGISKSTDGGVTFGPPVLLPTGGVPTFSFEDKEFLAVDNSGNPATNGNLYVSYTNFSFDPNDPTRAFPIAFSRSTDGGKTFSTPILVSPASDGAQGSEPIVAKNGDVYVTWLRFFSTVEPPGPAGIYVAKSTNGGKSFGSPVLVTNLTQIGFGGGTLTGGFRVNSFPRIDTSPVDGNVYIVYAENPSGPDAADAFLTRSTDGGTTWSSPKKLNFDGDRYEFFPDVAVNREGVVQVIWYREWPILENGRINERINVYKTQSRDEGLSFDPEKRVTGAHSPVAIGYDFFVNSIYMGDYIDIKAGLTPNGLGSNFLMAWGDFRRVVTTEGGTRHDQDVIFSVDK